MNKIMLSAFAIFALAAQAAQAAPTKTLAVCQGFFSDTPGMGLEMTINADLDANGELTKTGTIPQRFMMDAATAQAMGPDANNVPELKSKMTIDSETADSYNLTMMVVDSDAKFAQFSIPKKGTAKFDIFALNMHLTWGTFTCIAK